MNSTVKKIEKGDRVRLEGAELKGIVITVYEGDTFPNIKVRWDTGTTGMCYQEDLEHITYPVRQ